MLDISALLNEISTTNGDVSALIIAAASGIITFAVSFYLLRLITRRFVTREQYDQLNRHPMSWLIPAVVGLVFFIIIIHTFVQGSSSGIGNLWQTAMAWGTDHGITILLILLSFFIVSRVLHFVIPPTINNFVKTRHKGKHEKAEILKRSQILSRFFINIGYVTIFVISIFMILSELGIDIAPMLAAAGVVGIAVGLGSQKLIGDLINGAFIMLEDYYSIGDVVQIAGLSGQVEEVSIRTTVLRDLDGVVHIIPNSEVKIASNFTRNWSRININIPVSYNENLDKVISVLNRVGMQLSKDKNYRNMIITPPQVLRVDNFGDSAIEIKMLGQTKPIKQWEVAGELRKRIKETFDEERIEIPWPHAKVYFANPLNVKGEDHL